jgi:hypothetical protein
MLRLPSAGRSARLAALDGAPVSEHVEVFDEVHRLCRTRWPRSTRPELARRARLDAELVRRGLARSREQAAELVAAGW